MAKKYNNNINNTNTRIMEVPLSRFGVLVAQLESIVASAPQQPPDQLLCFDLLSDLISAIDQDTKDSIMLWQRRCEDALYSLLVIGVRRPVRHLASVAMTMIISKGDTISIYSRASSLQGFLSDGKKSEPLKVAGVAQCLGELYKHFGRRITSGLLETTTIAAKLLKFSEEFVRRETLHMLQNALEGSGGSAASTAYTEAFRLITRSATGDKSFSVRIAAARCLKAFASIGGPGLTALEDPVSSVRDAFAEALGSLLALGMNPEAQVQPRGKGPNPQPKKLEGGLQKHLVLAFRKASGVRSRDVRVGLTLSWVFFLQAIRIKYMHPDTELQNFALQVMEMLHADATFDAHASACVLYILRVGITDQMTEPTQRSFLVFLGKQLESPELGASMKVAALRTLSYTLKTLGEVPLEFKEVLDSTVVAAVSHSSKLVRIEAALALRALAEVDPPCVGGLTSYGVTALAALRESISFEKDLEAEVFDILSLWATLFTGDPENEVKKTEDFMSRIHVWSAAIHALTAFIRCFISPDLVNEGVLLQPVLTYLSRALSYISVFRAKEISTVKPAVDIFIIRTLIAYQSIPDPLSYKNDHPQIIEICTFPFRHASGCEESSCLRLLLDKRDAWLGPWTPGRDWFEDELRAFQGGKDGLMPCVWENEFSSFPQPETISKTLVNQMLLSFGIMFASQDSAGMLSLLGIVEQCLKSGKKQNWRARSVTNICVSLLAGFKALLSFRSQTLGQEILGLAQSIFQTRSLLADLNGASDFNYAGSIALALGCIHRSAGGIALSTLVPATVSSISTLAKSSVANLQIWSMHGLLLTIEAAGLSFVSHVQATLGLAMDILLSDDNGLVDIQQGVGRLINAIVAVLGPELAPGSIFFSRCKSAVAEISCWQETSTMLESARFTQQLVLFAPQAVSVHSHVQTLLSTMSSRQPTLRHLAISTLRHLIEKDPASVIVEQIEDNLFFMLDEETDSEIGNLVRTTIMRLLYASCPSCPSHWISVFRKVVLATSMRSIGNNNIAANDNSDGDTLNFGDDEDMVSSSNNVQSYTFQGSVGAANREKYLRYRTRLFAAECLSHLPEAVGRNPAHFDLLLARKEHANEQAWLVLHLQELISLAYQISTIQFESMQPVGVGLLGTIVDKFEKAADPELPGHLLLEQYQAQLVSAVRTTLDTSSSPSLLEAGLHLATKILTSGIISGDQVVVKRIFSLISRPLNDFKDIYYPSFAEWVTSKWNLFLDGLESPMVSSKLRPCLEESWPVMLQALALDAVPVNSEVKNCSKASVENTSDIGSTSQYSMVELKLEDFKFLWGFSLLGLFQSQHPILCKPVIQLSSVNEMYDGDLPFNEVNPSVFKLYEIVLLVFQFLSTERFFHEGLLTIDICKELLQIFSYSTYMGNSWNSLAISILSKVVKNCPQEFFDSESFPIITTELCLHYLFKVFQSTDTNSEGYPNWEENVICTLFSTTKAVMNRVVTKTQKLSKSMVLAFVLIGYKCIREASTEVCLSEAIDMANSTSSLLKKVFDYESEPDDNILSLSKMFGSCLSMVVALTKDCIEGLHSQEVKSFNQRKLLQKKLAFSLEQHILIAKLALEVEHVEEGKERNPIYVSALSYCIRCIQTVLSDSNIQVQVIGLQFLKAKVQRSKNTEDDSFLMFLVGELITDIFTLIQKMLKNPITRESVTIACECLSLMVLFQTLQKDDDCQRGFMSILLAAIVMVFLSTGDGFSQEVTDLRSTAIKLVSHLAQIPSSSVHFKDVLLSMPPLHRQQLQGVIRASVTQHNNPAELKMPVLDIKIPKPASRNEEEHSAPLPTTTQTGEINKEDVVSEDDVSEDDWDTFQSFPVTTDDGGNESKVEHASVDGDPSVVKTSFDMDGSVGADESQECSASEHDDNENKLNSDEFLEAVKEEVISDTPNQPSFNRLKTEQYDIQTDDDANKPYYNENQERDEALQSSGVQNEAESIPRDEPVSLDYQADVEAKGSTEDFGADYLQKDYIPEPVSDSLAFQQGFSESDFNENANKENRINEDDSYDQQQGKCDSPVETEHIGAKQYDIQTNAVANKPDDNESKEEEEIKQSSGVQSEAESIRGDEQVPHDHQSKVEPKGSIEDLGAAVHLQKVDIPEQVVSDSLALKQDSREKDCYDQHQGKCESPVESEHISTKLESPVEHEEE
ncbi:hypothetical protein TanjilG_26692 [Lupinus angustifolius]|uniref:Uncharacterized protein n=1 Tax=Lupinus angustifolius TaxID=3871 RepID=A0A1J7H0V6_LUPAN|nr:hypothetical protein TanjilG_26692 [Lupinus angustifolius]